MKFQYFLQIINALKTIPLGGLKDQFKMAPKLRSGYNEEKIRASDPKKAGVLVLFYPSDEGNTTFLLTERASYNGTHSAQISFPGGKIEKKDRTISQTALRETFEEVGIEKKDVNIIRELTEVYIPPSNFLVTPFLAFMKEKPLFKINREVAKVLEVSLKDLLDDTNVNLIDMKTSYMDQVSVPCFNFNHSIVWGATGMMLSEIKEIIKKIPQ